ncbi:sugar ABC transporter permease [Kaistia sp. 32K]|uniref:ABC transporter permease n=1 Tax=Kaistia sp. 32K TaxID=2795690 RepID=UPI001915159E|nr:ABC transporter permease [Kaistia sp. 32K]BCP54846.1 sugar ABC transporter permease [Kaistia sp. 32K]
MGETYPEKLSTRTLLLAVLLLAVVTALFTPDFLSPYNLLDVAATASVTGIFALGLLVVLLAGGLDISFTAIASITQFGLAVVLARTDLGWTLSILLVSVTGLAFGVLNGALVTWLRTPPIVVTIALLNIYAGALILVSRGAMLYDFPEFFSTSVVARIGGYPLSLQLVLLLVFALVTAFILRGTHWGRIVRAVGGSREAASRQGISILAVNLFAYGYLGLASGVAGLAQAQLLQAVTPGALVGRELDVVAATVLGGASLIGGRGTVLGTLLGVLFIGLFGNALVLNGVSPYWHQVATGSVVLISLCLQLMRRRQTKARALA